MSANLAARICAIDPLINYEWLLTGEGEMLRPSAGPVVANNSDNTAAHINVATAGASINETERWLALYEAQQREREKLHAEREKLTDTLVEVMKKLAAGLPAIIIIAAALSLSACNKDSGCHWHVVSHQWSEDNPVGMGYIDSTLYCEGAPVVSRHHGW